MIGVPKFVELILNLSQYETFLTKFSSIIPNWVEVVLYQKKFRIGSTNSVHVLTQLGSKTFCTGKIGLTNSDTAFTFLPNRKYTFFWKGGGSD